jgi:hypothetical protein
VSGAPHKHRADSDGESAFPFLVIGVGGRGFLFSDRGLHFVNASDFFSTETFIHGQFLGIQRLFLNHTVEKKNTGDTKNALARDLQQNPQFRGKETRLNSPEPFVAQFNRELG